MADIGLTESSEVTIASADGGSKLLVNTDGSLNVQVTPGAVSVTGAFSFTAEISTSTAEADVILVRNPGASGKKVFISLFAVGAVTGGRYGVVRVYRGPTVTTTGTAITISSATLSASPPTSSIQAFSSPTISARGTAIRTYTTGQFETSANLIQTVQFDLPAGRDLLITMATSGNNSVFAYNMGWTEV